MNAASLSLRAATLAAIVSGCTAVEPLDPSEIGTRITDEVEEEVVEETAWSYDANYTGTQEMYDSAAGTEFRIAAVLQPYSLSTDLDIAADEDDGISDLVMEAKQDGGVTMVTGVLNPESGNRAIESVTLVAEDLSRSITSENADAYDTMVGDGNIAWLADGSSIDVDASTTPVAGQQMQSAEMRGGSYAAFGAWVLGTVDDEDANIVHVDRIVMVRAGLETDADAMPNGTASYSGTSIGWVVEEADANARWVSADVSIAVDFDAGTGTLTNANAFDDDEINVAGAEFSIDIALDGAGYTGVATDEGTTGALSGAFYGPGAVETAGDWNFTRTGVGTYIASFGADQ